MRGETSEFLRRHRAWDTATVSHTSVVLESKPFRAQKVGIQIPFVPYSVRYSSDGTASVDTSFRTVLVFHIPPAAIFHYRPKVFRRLIRVRVLHVSHVISHALTVGLAVHIICVVRGLSVTGKSNVSYMCFLFCMPPSVLDSTVDQTAEVTFGLTVHTSRLFQGCGRDCVELDLKIVVYLFARTSSWCGLGLRCLGTLLPQDRLLVGSSRSA